MADILTGNQGKSTQLRTAYLVALMDDYGEVDAGRSFEFETFVGPLSALFDVVTVYPVDRRLRALGYFGMNAELERLVRQDQPDLLFCVPFENQLDWAMLGRLRATATTTVAWMCDDHWRYEPFGRWIAPMFDAVATTDRTAFARYLGQPGVQPVLTQWGFDPERFHPQPGPPLHDVSFVGQRRPTRERFVTALQQSGVDVFVAGRGWDGGRVSSEDLGMIPARSRLSLNFSDSTVAHGKGRTQLKARPFELAGTGTCIVSQDDPQVLPFFTPGKEIATFANPGECVRVVSELLADAARARGIGDAARRRAESEHTYEKRLIRILSSLGFGVGAREERGAVCVTN